jgi:hypothetical protein
MEHEQLESYVARRSALIYLPVSLGIALLFFLAASLLENIIWWQNWRDGLGWAAQPDCFDACCHQQGQEKFGELVIDKLNPIVCQ